MLIDREIVIKNYESAKKVYAMYGVDTDKMIDAFKAVPISLHNWQGDDVTGFEDNSAVSGDLVITGNYPGKARNGKELRADIDKVFSYSPSKPRVNIHSMYGEPGTIDRAEVTTEDFREWINWAKKNGYAMDFNVSFFTHKMMRDGFCLASSDKKTRDYWIKAGIGGRKIANDIGKELGETCINNIWVPDGLKDIPANRFSYRDYLEDSLNQMFEIKYDRNNMRDTLEGKLFAVGVESFTVGSHEFYLGYAAKNGVGICMDTGHYHPTESIVDKISSVRPFVDTVLLHISRGVRWDSDHVVLQGDELTAVMQEVVRGHLYNSGQFFIGLDYFDASINRLAAWTIGLRAAGKSLLAAFLEPFEMLKKTEQDENYTERLALMEEFKNMPINAVWDYACLLQDKPIGTEWIDDLKKYEADSMLKRK